MTSIHNPPPPPNNYCRSIEFTSGAGSHVNEAIESAYRLIPVHPQDRPLLAMEWKGKVFIDPMLPFGLHSALKIFNAVADALNWILHRAGIEHVYPLPG